VPKCNGWLGLASHYFVFQVNLGFYVTSKGVSKVILSPRYCARAVFKYAGAGVHDMPAMAVQVLSSYRHIITCPHIQKINFDPLLFCNSSIYDTIKLKLYNKTWNSSPSI
jgi:hypothetical protein